MRSWRSATTASDPLRQRARTYKSAFSGVVHGATDRIGAHSTGKADAERPRLRLAFKKRPSTLRLAKLVSTSKAKHSRVYVSTTHRITDHTQACQNADLAAPARRDAARSVGRRLSGS